MDSQQQAGRFPKITPVAWLSAKDVLGGEASDFTPWLMEPANLEVLGTALKLEDLTAVNVEHNVLGKRLDILASALDENGEEVPVCIENQYGMTDADHLGRLIAYLAQHERGRAVWVVEQAHDAFVAAVRFLNRTSTDDVGFYLVKVLFTHGVDEGYQVHFDVLAAPIAWESPGRRGGAVRPKNQSKVTYLEAIHHAVRPALLAAGFASMNTHARGAYLWIQWPPTLWFRRYARRLDIRVTKDKAIVAVYVSRFDSKAANSAAADVLRKRYEAALATRLPEQSLVDWDIIGSGRRKAIRVELAGAGYVGGDPQEAAAWAVDVCTTWLETMATDPVLDLQVQVEETLPGSGVTDADDETELEDD
jgi:hypothetical protein